MTAIRVRNLWKVFGKRPDEAIRLARAGKGREEILRATGSTVALQDVSFDVAPGELFVLMGLSGCGKSTLLRALNRLNTPTSGTVHVGGVDVTSLDASGLRELRRKKVGMVFQHFALFPHRTVLENVAFGLEVQGVSKPDREAKAMEALELVQLAGWAHKPPSDLSGGMRQRVGVARALAIEPDILLMDEPFGALDPLIRASVQQDLMKLRETLGKTIVFVTHDLDEALTLGDRIAIMREGRIVQAGPPAEIAVQPEDPFVEAFVENVNKARVLKASDIMRPPVILLRPDTAPTTAIRRMDEHDLESAFVAYRDGQLVGTIAMSDAMAAAQAGETTIQRAIAQAPVVRPETLVEEVLRVVLAQRRAAAVVDAQGRLVGVVRRKNLLPAFTSASAPAAGVA
ncbi:MAG TPA: glycine betaine/L-proline ABC transporter ATP-binding protein [Candidatus Thermoplasmatota archaeon]|nr:glycine betaine/L-proline ABC transporter ATP-binding protein [Candidatus Thermoplasmatota archaeon]